MDIQEVYGRCMRLSLSEQTHSKRILVMLILSTEENVYSLGSFLLYRKLGCKLYTNLKYYYPLQLPIQFSLFDANPQRKCNKLGQISLKLAWQGVWAKVGQETSREPPPLGLGEVGGGWGVRKEGATPRISTIPCHCILTSPPWLPASWC